MPVDRATAERALRAAHAAGDVEGARIIAKGIKDQGLIDQPRGFGETVARGVGGTLGATAGFAAGGPVLGVLGGGAGQALGGEAYRYAERHPALTEPPSTLEAIFPVPAAVARLGKSLLEEPTRPDTRTAAEVGADVRDDFRGGAAGGALGFLARGPLALLEKGAKSFGRGLRTREGAQIAMHEQRAAQAAAGVEDTRGPVKTFAAELAKLAGLGTGAEIMSGGLTSGGAAIATTVLRLPEATKAVLTNSPGFARWALSQAPSAAVEGAASATGQAAELSGEGMGFTAEQTDALLEVMAEEGPEVAAAIRDFVRQSAIDAMGKSR